MDKQSFEELTTRYPDWIPEEENRELHSFRNGNYIVKGDNFLPILAEHYEVDDMNNHAELLLSESRKRYMILDRSNEEYPALELVRVDQTEHEQIHLIPKV